MSDDERLKLRDLPPVPPVAIRDPRRHSQTLLAKADACLRSAYLYLKWNGGPGSHAMDRGTVVHMGAERVVLDLLRHGLKSYVELALSQGPGGAMVAEDIEQAERDVASMTKAIVDEILEEHPELSVTSLEADAARSMLYHFALGMDVDPETVLGIERKFVLDLDCGVTVSGKIDLLTSPEVRWLQVDDYKTSFNVPPEDEFDELHSFQTKLYALLAVYGNPVEKVDGEEVRLPNVGEGVFYVRGRQLYPRPRLRELPDGRKEMVQRERVFTRQELADFKLDVERIAKRLLGALESWKFPAVPGRHCSECPSPAECPLPSHLRRYAGMVNSHEEAQEALAWALVQGEKVGATMKEIKAWAAANGPIVLGDALHGFEVRVSTSRQFRTRNKRSMLPEFIEAAERAAKFGERFDPDEFLRPPGKPTNVFGEMKVSRDVVERRREELGAVAKVDLGDGESVDPPGEE